MAEQTQAVVRTGTAGLKAILAQPAYSKRFEEIMGKRAPQFMASIISVASSLPEDTEPQTIVTSAMIAATLDLPINKDLGFAWIVPYRNKGVMQAQFQMGHKGFIQLALRSGQYARMNARVINAEAFGGYDSVGEPVIHWDKIDESKETVGYCFAWKLVGGFTKICYWTKERVQAHASRYSQAYSKGYNSPWKTHFNEMALKTVIKNELSDWGILSVEMRQAQKFDQAVVIDVDSEILHYPDNNQLEDVPRAEATPGPTAPAKAPFRRGAQASQLIATADHITVKDSTGATHQVPVPKGSSMDDYNKIAQAALVAVENQIAEDKAKHLQSQSPQPSNVINIPTTVIKQGEDGTRQKFEVEPDPQPAASAPTASAAQTSPPQSSASAPSAAAPKSSAPKEQKVAFVLPPSRMSQGWIPTIDPLDPEGTKKSLYEILTTEEITPEELLAWCEGRGLSKKGQQLSDLAISKIIGLIKQRNVWRADVLAARQ